MSLNLVCPTTVNASAGVIALSEKAKHSKRQNYPDKEIVSAD